MINISGLFTEIEMWPFEKISCVFRQHFRYSHEFVTLNMQRCGDISVSLDDSVLAGHAVEDLIKDASNSNLR